MASTEDDPSGDSAETIKYSTCYMCACRCGIKVHLKNGAVRYIEGNRDHPVNRGVLCAKGAAGIMHHTSPARLRKPLLRVGERGSGEFQEIEWEDALQLATRWLSEVRQRDPSRLAFFTGRDQSQALTGWWARQFGTPNYAAHGGFCSVNMAAAGLYTLGGAFWEFGEPDWDQTRYFMMFGVAEDHDSNPIKIGLGKLKERGAKFVSVNPIRTGYSAIADEWIGIRPGTDGLFVLALIHELLRAGRVDALYLARYTNASWLVIDAPGTSEHGLFARNEAGRPLCWDQASGRPADALDPPARIALKGRVTLPDGRPAVPSFHLLAERYLDARYAPASVAEETGIAAEDIQRIAAELAHAAFQQEIVLDQPWTDWTGRRHEQIIGRPVSMHAMRGISAHSNGFHTCRALHLLQALLGSVDTPGGWEFKSPYPKGTPPDAPPAGRPGEVRANEPLAGAPLGFPTSPEHLVVDDTGQPCRIDKAFSWEAPLGIHGMLQMVIRNAWAYDPYPIDTLFLYMSNMAWNSAMNTPETIRMLCDKDPETGEYKIPRIIYCDAFYSETVPYADLVLPDTTYLERWDCMSLLDRPIGRADGPADSIRQPVVAPDRDVRPFQSVLLDLGARLSLPGMTRADGSPAYPGGYADYLVNHERKPGIGSLAGWRGAAGDEHGRGAPNPDQLDAYVRNGCFWQYELAPDQRYLRHVNRGYQEEAVRLGLVDSPTPTLLQLYCEPLQRFRLAAEGHGAVQPPERDRSRVLQYCDPLPIWYRPFEDANDALGHYPLHAVTQRPMSQYHSWGSQNPWLRQIMARNQLYVARTLGTRLDLRDGDQVRVRSRHASVLARVKLMDGLQADTVWTWNAIAKRKRAWTLSAEAPEASHGFLLNHLIDELLPKQENGYRYAAADPVTGQAAWYDLRVAIEKAPMAHAPDPDFPAFDVPEGLGRPAAVLAYDGTRNRADDES